jgi:hypothetical protein
LEGDDLKGVYGSAENTPAEALNRRGLCRPAAISTITSRISIVGAVGAAGAPLAQVTLDDLNIDTRLRNCLGRYGVETAADIVNVDPNDFMGFPNVGTRTIEHLRKLQDDLADGHYETVRASPGADGFPDASRECADPEDMLSEGSSCLRMSVRLQTRLEAYGVATVADVLAVDDEVFVDVPGVGQRTLGELHELQRAIIGRTNLHREPEELQAEDCGSGTRVAEPVALMPLWPLVSDDSLVSFLGEEIGTVKDLLGQREALQVRAANSCVSHALTDLIKKVWILEANYRARVGHPGGPLPSQVEKRMYSSSASLRQALVGFVEASLCEASERNRRIVIRRLGLTGDGHGSYTLEEIAEGYVLSRERIRQIEDKWSERLFNSRYVPCLSRLQQEVLTILQHNLGYALLDEVVERLMSAFGWSEKPQRHEIELLCEFVPDITMSSEGTICHDGVCGDLEGQVKEVAVELAAQNGTSRKLVNFAHDISDALRGRCYGSHRNEVFEHCGLDDNAGERVLPLGYLRCVLAECDPPILDPETEEIVSPDLWRLRFSKTRQELGRTALKLLGKPTHYSKVAAFIRERSRAMPDISDGVVQHALQSAEECVSVDRGVYALAEWDVERELTHGDAIEKLLREKGQPLPKSRIFRILRSQGYKENNLNVALDQQRFVEVGGDVYDLRDRHKPSKTKGNKGVSIRARKRKSTRIQI